MKETVDKVMKGIHHHHLGDIALNILLPLGEFMISLIEVFL